MISYAVSAYVQSWSYLVMCTIRGIGMLEQLECIFMAKQEAAVWILKTNALRERCPNTEFFLVRIFLYLF